MSRCSVKLDVRASVRMLAPPGLQVAALPCMFGRHLLHRDGGYNYRDKRIIAVVVSPSESLCRSSSRTPPSHVTNHASLRGTWVL